MKTILKKILPRPYYESLKRHVFYGFTDALDRISGRREALVPPKRMIFIGGAAYKEIGDEFFGHFREFGGLKPTDAVLDVGCGIGRMARPLTGFLSGGSYEGFDIDAKGIKWCREHITPRHPNFRFQVADIYNKHYNPRGSAPASSYRFPYPDRSFDFVFLTSVFTHMFPEDVENYTGEIARVLRPGGRCFITFFLWNAESAGLVRSGRSRIPFVEMKPGFYVQDKSVPEDATGFDEAWVRGLYGRLGLEITEPIRFGGWCGREPHVSYQDIVVAVKRG